jgi:glycosyltransferase involved in cell wall biosynthesis
MDGLTKKILFISYDGMTDPLGQSQVIPYLIGLTKYNFHFTILSCEKSENFSRHKEYVENLLKPYPIKWVHLRYHRHPKIISAVYDVVRMKKTAKQLHHIESFDMIHTRAGIPSLVGLWMKEKLGVKFLHDIREFYADSRVEGGMWNLKNILYRIVYNYFKKKEIAEVDNCDGIVCLTYAAEKIMLKWPQLKKPKPIEVIPCSVDLQLFDPEKIDCQRKQKIKKALGISENDFVVSYLGSLGGWYLTEEMIRFLKIILEKNPNAKFLFISPHHHKKILNTSLKFGIPAEKIIVKNARRDGVPLLLSLSNYSIFFIKPCYSKKSSSPTKHGEIMAMGIPLITNAGVGDVEEIVEKYSSGFVLKKLEEDDFVHHAGILKKIHFDPYKIRQGAIEFYDLNKAVEKYSEVYNQILN